MKHLLMLLGTGTICCDSGKRVGLDAAVDWCCRHFWLPFGLARRAVVVGPGSELLLFGLYTGAASGRRSGCRPSRISGFGPQQQRIETGVALLRGRPTRVIRAVTGSFSPLSCRGDGVVVGWMCLTGADAPPRHAESRTALHTPQHAVEADVVESERT